jgi:hypothetical protein
MFLRGVGEDRLYSCKNSQPSFFLHRLRSQCLHTKLLKDVERMCLSAHVFPKGQWPWRYNAHVLRLGSRPKRYSSFK